MRLNTILALTAAVCLSSTASAQDRPEGERRKRTTEAGKTEGQEQKKGVPILRSLPLLGDLFQDGANRERIRGKAGQARPDGLDHVPYLRVVQQRTLHEKIPGLEFVDIVATRRQRLTKDTVCLIEGHEIEYAGTAEAEAQAKAMLEQWHALRDVEVQISFHVVDQLASAEGRKPTWGFEKLTKSRYRSELEGLRKDSRTNIVTAPTVVAKNGSPVFVSILNQISYIRDFDVEVAQDSFIADPVVDTVESGFHFGATPVLDLDGNGLSLELNARIDSVKTPIETTEIRVLPGTPLEGEIQVPTIFVSRRQFDDIRLDNEHMAFRVSGLRALEGDWCDEGRVYQLYGLITIKSK